MPNKNYNVGYKKPPKKSQFKKGVSGNPKGRPRGVKNLVTDLAEELSQKIPVVENGKPMVITKQRAVIKAQVAKAIKGDTRAATAVLGLVPTAEQAQAQLEEKETLSKVDNEILEDFRKQLLQEIKSVKKEKP